LQGENRYLEKTRLEILSDFVQMKPKDSFARYGLAMELCKLGDNEKALEAFKKTTDLSPDFGWGWRMRGMAEAEVGHIEGAKVSLRMAYELDSDLTIALNQLAELSEQTTDEDQEFWALDQLAAVISDGAAPGRAGPRARPREAGPAARRRRRCARRRRPGPGGP
jgi:tetratricopeptide (TPR) repeat protein